MKTLLAVLMSVCTIVVLSSCDGGLEPYPIPPDFTGFRGTVYFAGDSAAWPTDSIYNLVVVAFEEKPDSVGDILPAVLGGRAVFSKSMPLFVDSATYEIELPADRERTFRYVVVGMQDGPAITQDWTMLSIHAVDNDPLRPDSVTIVPGKTTIIDFNVDFSNLPPQPFD
ncbi:MAG: hypothetical protein FGM24_10785 [Candidatus Kapabacteria bacterium]|nr:hypothetical protein [Candidatus Kapabacteria bacterium]